MFSVDEMSKDEKWLVVSRSGSTRSVSSITSLTEQNGDIGIWVKFFPFFKNRKKNSKNIVLEKFSKIFQKIFKKFSKIFNPRKSPSRLFEQRGRVLENLEIALFYLIPKWETFGLRIQA